jgi:L-threonylcarbamoyladenylate synthase
MASPFAIRHAAHQIRQGGVIAYPTDTVYGLGCNPMDMDAVKYLNTLKQRDDKKGLILIANRLELFNDYITSLSSSDRQKIEQVKSPTSWIVNAKNNVPHWLTGGSGTLAIRITQNPVISGLCDQLHHPLVSTSANPGGKKPARNALQLHTYFSNKVSAILIASNELNNQPSSIRVLDSNLIIRP